MVSLSLLYVSLMMLPLLSDTVVSGMIQLVISLGGAGLVVQLLLLRQNRRKIAGQASATEANAASTLSGAALKMVENAQQAQLRAEQERDQATAMLRERTEEYDAESHRKDDQLNRMRWRNHHLTMWSAILKGALTAARVPVPDEPTYEEYGDEAPPERPGPGPLALS